MTKRGKKKNAAAMPKKNDQQEAPGITLDVQKPDKIGREDVQVLQLYDEHAESVLDSFFCSKSNDWSLKYFNSQVQSYEMLAPGFEDDERILWIKNIFYVLQNYLAQGASKYDAYVRSQWSSACRLKLRPSWSGDSVGELHDHLRRWDPFGSSSLMAIR